MKKTNTKPIIYNFNYCNNIFEAYVVVPLTKFKNSKDFTDLERDTIVYYIAGDSITDNVNPGNNGETKIFINEFDTLDEIIKFMSGNKKKSNIFKRFWNWITRKK